MKNLKNIALSAFIIASLGAKAATPVFYPSAPDQPRIQFLTTINGSASLLSSDNPFGDRFPGYNGGGVTETDPLKKPFGVTSVNGKIYVCDAAAGVVQVFDLDKKVTTKFGNTKPGKLAQPMNIVVTDDGTKYVADSSVGKVLVYDKSDLYVRSIGAAKGFQPLDLVISKGKLYVTDLAVGQVIVFDPKTGVETARISQGGLNATDLVRGTNITADKDGNIYVSDSLGGKVSVFTEAGKFVRNLGSLGDGLGQFTRAKGLAIDNEKRLYVVDGAFENVQIFNNEDKLLMPFGDVGNGVGGLNMPAKVSISYGSNKFFKKYVAPGYDIDYLIFVTNQFGQNRLNVYGFLKKL